MSHWIVVAHSKCPVARYVTQVVAEDELQETAGEGKPLSRWVVEACEGQIQQLTTDPLVVRITWERR